MKMELVADFLMEIARAHPDLDLGQVFINEMPLQCKHGVLLMDSYPEGTPIDPYIPLLRFGGLRMVVRSAPYSRGYRLARQLERLATDSLERVISGKHLDELLGAGTSVLLRGIRVVNEPTPYKSSDGGFNEFEMEVELNYIAP
ncbi:hypothetical protein ATN89_17475 [Comamonas thiooxydans]|uniref:hypothetical protein n=1 Tax=Comamonas thiooxydans TaxID=363952 RepID=UPI0007C4DB7C|nr:hypothetical protein [Comamonas thiooxydans]OAD82873.1 hypothetical protein ATN89_17475 [Comamonas thiooxydans]